MVMFPNNFKRVIGLDMDGVILDNTASKIQVAKKLGFDLTPAQAQSDIIEKILSADALHNLRQAIYDNPVMIAKADLVAGALEGLKAIKNSGHDYFLISRRKNPDLAVTALKQVGIWPEYLNESNAFFVGHAEEKNLKAIELGINIYVDDQPSVLEKLIDVKHRLLFDRFGNFGNSVIYKKKVASWQELLSSIL